MKTMKRFATLILVMCMAMSCFSLTVFAADGRIMFTDPKTKTGETVEVTGVVEKSNSTIGKIEIVMKYDTELLKFKSGSGITETSAGKLTYTGDATSETGNRKEFTFSFTALKEGTAKIEITDATIKNVAGSVMNYTKGSSTVTIEKGTATTQPTPSSDTIVTVNDLSYTISDEFPENEIPKGYEEATLEYDLVEYPVVYNESTGLYLAYLIDEEMLGNFFMYVEEDATFAPYQEIAISEDITIVLLSDVSEVVLPEEYQETTVVLNDFEFPAWQIPEETGFCLIYAMNNYGEVSLYRVDNSEGTYQRFFAPQVETAKNKDSWLAKLSTILEEHLDYVILGTGLGFIVFLLIIIILSVKLYNRNAELDEIYDEYGIDFTDKTQDDVLIHINDEDDEYDDEEIEEGTYDDITLDTAVAVQEDIKELLPEEPTEDIVEELKEKVVDRQLQNDSEEETLGAALKEVVAQQDEEFFEDELFEDFSVDFIDLDD